MTFKREDVYTVTEIVKNMAKRHETEGEGYSFKDAPSLNKIAKMAATRFKDNDAPDQRALADGIAIYSFLGGAYECMHRYQPAAEYMEQACRMIGRVKEEFKEIPDNAAVIFERTVTLRNTYVEDDCKDVMEIAGKVFGDTGFLKKAFERKPRVVRDPVEMSKEYLAVIDEVEEKAFKQMKGTESRRDMQMKIAAMLAEKGVKWNFPVLAENDKASA